MSTIRRIAMAGMFAASLGAAAQPPQTQPAAEDPARQEAAERAEMRREVEEAVRAIDAYTVARRDDATQRARVAMERMDQRIAGFQARWAAETERIRAESQASRERAAERIRDRRAVLQERYRAMEQSNAEAWALARERFVRAYRDLAGELGADSSEPAGDETGGDEQEEKQEKR